jgi:RNA polymerase sigma-70 factor (ECF subfamily)
MGVSSAAVHYHQALFRSKQTVVAREALEHLDALHRFARHIAGPDADDLVQETFARALDRHEQFTVGSSMRSWLFRILRNAHIDNLRKKKREVIDDVEHVRDDRELFRGDRELELLRRVVADDIVNALSHLSEDARAVIALDLEDFTEAEIADVLSIAPGTVKSRLSRARAALRQKLQGYAK